jgi:cell division protease FtsH
MKKMSFSKLLVLLLFVATAGYLVYYFTAPLLAERSITRIPYQSFYRDVEAGMISSAEIDSGKITFTKTGSSGKYSTDNPGSPVLTEFLMRNGVTVKIDKDAGDTFSKVFDIVFYVFFFGILIIAFRKFISPNTFRVVHHTGVSFKDVVGMDGLKHDMTQVMDIMQHSAEYAKRGIRMPKGILLEGAPGNGKTLFAKALAGEAKVNFIPAKATDFESMFMAIGPLKVKLLFSKARRRAPCIVFIDEFDGIGTRRNYSGSAIETENTRIVTALLNELDGFQPNNGILVLAATNSISALDEALIRPGRFDARFSVPYPDMAARENLVEMYMNGKAHAAECTPETLAKMFNGFSCAKIESVLNRAALVAGQLDRTEFTLDDVRIAGKEQQGA